MERYTLEQLSEMCGLTDRTLRTYLSYDILTGEKKDGMWTFSEEDVGSFFAQPVIRQRLAAKATGMVMDFLLLTKKKEAQACTVLDVPVDDEETFRANILAYVNSTANSGFRYDHRDGVARIVFTGTPEATAGLMGLLSAP